MRRAMALLLLVGACGLGEDLDFGTWAWDVPAHDQGGSPSRARYGARGGACPAEAPVVCGDLCCAAGAACAPEGCTVPRTPGQCGASETLCTSCAAAGCALADSSSQGNHATARDGMLLGGGRFEGGALPYAHEGDCTNAGALTAPTNGFPAGNDPMSIELWVRYPTAAGPAPMGLVPLLAWGSAAGGYRALGRDGGTLQLVIGSTSCTFSYGALDDGGWHHLAATYDGAVVQLYVDGYAEQSCSASSVSTVLDGSVHLGPAPQIGPSFCGDLAPSELAIDEVRVSTRARNEDEIRAATEGPLTADADTVALWHFDVTVSCCPAGSTCGTDGRCCSGGTCSGRGGPSCPPEAPISCGVDCCPAGATCVAEGACLVAGPIDTSGPGCPPSHPLECGDYCCLGYAQCESDGTCGCPNDQEVCGALCCGYDATCVDGECRVASLCPNPDYPTPCGDALCCATGFQCVDGRCPCNDEYPIPCGDVCCLPDGICDGILCSCPPGRAPCGVMTCCDPGQVCVDGLCKTAQSGGETCPGGWMGSTASYVPLGSGGSCTGGGDTDYCITEEEFTAATGLPLPAACNPEGSGGCIDTATGLLVRPCCSGLACRVTDVCGQSPLLQGGTCQK